MSHAQAGDTREGSRRVQAENGGNNTSAQEGHAQLSSSWPAARAAAVAETDMQKDASRIIENILTVRRCSQA